MSLGLMGALGGAMAREPAEPLWLGMVNVRSGPAGHVGRALHEGAEAVFEDVNRRGGVNGRPVKMDVGDDSADPDQTMVETLKLLDRQQPIALFGYIGTSSVHAVLPLVQEMRLPLVGGVTGSMTVRVPVTREIFSVRPSFQQETEALVEHLTADGARRIAVVYQYDGLGMGVLAATKQALERRGMKLSAVGDFQRGSLAVRTAYASMMEAQPDAIVLAGFYPSIAELVRKLRQGGLKSQLVGVSAVGADGMVNELGPLANGMVFTQALPFPDDERLPVTRECRRLLREQHAKTDLNYASFEGCVSAMLMVRALEKTGPEPTREGLMKTLETMGPQDLGGITLDIRAYNHQALQPVYLTHVKNDHLQPLQAGGPATQVSIAVGH